jgi:hypothetical protein
VLDDTGPVGLLRWVARSLNCWADATLRNACIDS